MREDEQAGARLRKLSRNVAGCIVAAMGESDTSFAQIDARLGKKSGYAKKFVVGLIEGESTDMRSIGEVAFACGGAMLVPKIFKPTSPEPLSDQQVKL